MWIAVVVIVVILFVVSRAGRAPDRRTSHGGDVVLASSGAAGSCGDSGDAGDGGGDGGGD